MKCTSSWKSWRSCSLGSFPITGIGFFRNARMKGWLYPVEASISLRLKETLPSLSKVSASNDHIQGRMSSLASGVLETGMPNGWPAFFSLAPILIRSCQLVLSVYSAPASLKYPVLMISGYEMYQDGIASHLPFTWPMDVDSLIQGPC